jgi:hypothetical protein
MALSRFQFRLNTLLWITLAMACFFGGMKAERWFGERDDVPSTPQMPPSFWGEKRGGFVGGESQP